MACWIVAFDLVDTFYLLNELLHPMDNGVPGMEGNVWFTAELCYWKTQGREGIREIIVNIT